MENKSRIFISKIQEKEKKLFNSIFLKSTKKKSSYFWKYPESKNHAKILKNIKENDWFLFSVDRKYQYAAKVSKSEKYQISFKEIKSINRSFMRTNKELGIASNHPAIHNFSLLHIDDDFTKLAIKKFGSIENFLVEQKVSTIKPQKNTKKIIIDPASIKKIPKRVKTETVRVIRDTIATKKLKMKYENKCQVCSYKIAENYSDVHHIWPIGEKPVGGDDDFDNMLVLCPNHHAMFDLGLIQFDESQKWNLIHVNGQSIGRLHLKKVHKINLKNIEHNNLRVRMLHGT
jgi:predicted restriction endonuclease